MRIFIDFEFTGLRQNTTPISLGIVAEDGRKFYAEFNDFNLGQVDDWLSENVIRHLIMSGGEQEVVELGANTLVYGDKVFVSSALEKWISRYKKVEVWGDCMFYDGVLFNELFGGAFSIPANIDYIYYDISTMFKVLGVDPDISRESFIDRPIGGAKHNALYDAEVIQACFEKLNRNKLDYLS